MLMTDHIPAHRHSCTRARRGITLLASVLLTGSTVFGQNPVVSATERARTTYQLPGVSVCVFNASGIQSTVFMGVRELGRAEKIGPNDLYNLASCTKPMTATLAAIAVDQGKLTWESSLAEILPELAKGTPYGGVTLQQLLAHQSGLATLTDDETPLFKAAVLDAPENPRDARRHLTKILLQEPPISSPGTAFAYSNGGYTVAALMIETALGEDYETLLQREIFDKAEMATAIIGWPATPERPDQPRGHRVIDGVRVPEKLEENDGDEALSPAGGVSCSIEDFARFGITHLKGLSNHAGLASPEALKALHEATGKGNAAMGWFIRDLHGETIHYHDGGTGRFSVAVMLLPKHDVGVVVATNTGGGEGAGGEACQKLCIELLRLAMQRKASEQEHR